MRQLSQQPSSNPITDKDEFKKLIDSLQNEPLLAVDTEFIRENTFFPQVALIQIATDKKVFLIDPLALGDEISELGKILFNKNCLKIMHAAYADQECFYWMFKQVATPVLDTAVAAALLGLGENIGLAKLLKEILDIHVVKGRARAKWLARPLSPELLHYAEQDVRYLVTLGKLLMKRLEEKKRLEWAIEESEVRIEQLDEDPVTIAQRIGRNSHVDTVARFVLNGLVAWREKRARELDLPRPWIADNEVLLSLSKARPRSISELKTFRGLKPKEVEKSGEQLLSLIRKGEEEGKKAPLEESPTEDRYRRRASPHVVDMLKSYVSWASERIEIMPRFLLTSQEAEWISMHWDQSLEEWCQEGYLKKRAADLIGKELEEFIKGKKGLLIRKGRVELFSTS